MDEFGPVASVQIVRKPGETPEKPGKHRGYGFVEFKHKGDADRAYRKANGMRVSGRRIVVDRDRGRTDKNWLPRRLGGGIGESRFSLRDHKFRKAVIKRMKRVEEKPVVKAEEPEEGEL